VIRLLAGSMALVASSAWLLISRWERPGTRAEHRVRLRAPPLIKHGFDVALFAQLVYPILVLIAPDWTYEGPANWSWSIDVPAQTAGLILWMLGMTVLLWASRVMRRYLAIDGLATGHELVTHGPYRYVRHPVYGSFMAIALGTGLVFRSYLLLGLSVVLILTGLWWARAEERLLASTEGFGDAYRAYAARTGRFLPSLRRARADSI
jgi:protein-S-isoprenylcysteine O-methyltransferase Ste14